MDHYFLERHYQRLEESQALSGLPSQPSGSSPTRGSPLGKARSEPKLGAPASSSVKPIPAPISKSALLQSGIKEANKAAWSKTLGKEGNAITHSDAIARTSHVQSVATGHQRGGGGHSGDWMKSRNAKLRAQMPKAENKLFEGVVVCISGPTGPNVSDLQLKNQVCMHGGKVEWIPNSSVTHLITLNGLAGSKEQKRIGGTKFARSKLVRPEWIIDSIEAGKRQPEARYAVDRNTTQPTAYSAFSPATAPAKQSVPSRYESAADVPAYAPAPRVAMPLPMTQAKLRAMQPPVEHEPRPHQLKLEEAMEKAAARQAGGVDAAGAARMSKSPSAEDGLKRKSGVVVCGSGVKRRATEGEVQRLAKPSGLAAAAKGSPVRRTKSEGAVAKAKVGTGTECVTLDSSPLEVEVLNLASDDEDELDEFGMPPSGQRCSQR